MRSAEAFVKVRESLAPTTLPALDGAAHKVEDSLLHAAADAYGRNSMETLSLAAEHPTEPRPARARPAM